MHKYINKANDDDDHVFDEYYDDDGGDYGICAIWLTEFVQSMCAKYKYNIRVVAVLYDCCVYTICTNT